MKKLFVTNDSITNTILRVAVGLVIFPHGAQKLLGWFGGYGFEGTMGFLTGSVGLPAALAVLVILAESVGALALVTGLLGRVTAFGILAVMLGAVFTVHLPNGFFMNWSGAQGGEGFEYHLLVIAMTLPVILFGAGKYSVDQWIARKLEQRSEADGHVGGFGSPEPSSVG